MTRRFKDIIEMSPPSWIMDMAHFDVLSEEDIARELLELNEVPFLLGFPTTWLVETGFSAANDLLTNAINLQSINGKY